MIKLIKHFNDSGDGDLVENVEGLRMATNITIDQGNKVFPDVT